MISLVQANTIDVDGEDKTPCRFFGTINKPASFALLRLTWFSLAPLAKGAKKTHQN